MAVIAEGSVNHSEWLRVRDIVLARDDHRCQDCDPPEDAPDLDVHHLIPRAAGGTDEPSNLISLCDGHHAARHPNLQVSLSRRTIERWALGLACWLDRSKELPDEIAGLSAALHLFGKRRLREGQLEAVLTALRGESMLVIRPTGWGKSLCFQLPAVFQTRPTLVLSPLKALMKDQIVHLQQLKLPGTFINGDLSPQEKAARYGLLEQNALKFLYVTPERFNGDRIYNKSEIERLKNLRPAFLVVDEAHCIDRWGADFRPDYARIGAIRELLGNPPILAFTATAGQATQDRILDSLGIPEARRLITGADRPNIALIRHSMPGGPGGSLKKRAQLIANLVRELENGKAMIFVPTKRTGNELQEAISMEGLDLPFYHANAGSPNERDMVSQRFMGLQEPPLDAVICTNAFGMGLDVPDVRLVIHWQHPASVEDYLQEFGRAGRDGKPALAVLLSTGEDDIGLLDFMAKKTAEEAVDQERAQNSLTRKREQIAELNRLVTERGACFRAALLDYLVGRDRHVEERSVARRLLEWVFAEGLRVSDAPFCCDACDPEKAALVLGTPH